MPSRSDNDEERLARIQALVEEYRVKHEDLEAYVRSVRDRAATRRGQSRKFLAKAQASRRRPK